VLTVYLCQLTKKYVYDFNMYLQMADLILPQSLERDGKQCVITKMGAAVESAHIYPYSLRSLSGLECGKFWSAMFWPESVIEDWKSDVSGGGDTERCANRISLSADAHVFYRKGLFALKQVSMSEDPQVPLAASSAAIIFHCASKQ
jgi:hypothetical protein